PREIARGDLVDGPTWEAWQALRQKLEQVPSGTLSLAGVPAGSTIRVDGVEVEAGVTELALRPGEHFVHALHDGVIAGRRRVEILPGEITVLPLAVSEGQL